MKLVKQQIKSKIEQIYEEDDSPQAMKKLGIDTIQGTAKFDNERTITVTTTDKETGTATATATATTTTLHANCGVLICTGASPMKPTNIAGLESVEYITYENAFDIDELPKTMTVVGAGPIGCEIGQAYSRLGVKVTLIANNQILPREESEAGECLQRVFENEGIRVINSRLTHVEKQSNDNIDNDDHGHGHGHGHIASCQNGENVSGDILLLALGRKPVVTGMGLSDIGVELNEMGGGIKVDTNLRTTVQSIYAAGDCTGDRQFTHYAGYQGAVGARNILLPFSDPGMMEFVPGSTFTDPQVASVGLIEEEAKKKYGESRVKVAYKEIKETDRGICDDDKEGYIKIVFLKKGKILGASIVSPVAAELITEITMAMKNGIPFDQLATVVHTYPSHSFTIQSMAAEVYYDKLVKLRPILNFLKRLGL